MKKVSQDEILKVLYEDCQGDPRLTRSRFSEAMLISDLMVDRSTIATRWTQVRASRYVDRLSDDTVLLRLPVIALHLRAAGVEIERETSAAAPSETPSCACGDRERDITGRSA